MIFFWVNYRMPEVPQAFEPFLSLPVVRIRQTKEIVCPFFLLSCYVFMVQLISKESSGIHYQKTATPKPVAEKQILSMLLDNTRV